MSMESFVKHGHHYGVVYTKPGGAYGGEIEICDIGEPGLVGAIYSDGSYQAQPYSWHHGIERRLATHVRQKPQLKKPALARPTLQKPSLTAERGMEPKKPPFLLRKGQQNGATSSSERPRLKRNGHG